tara:strand:- start:86 stop:625 length:540 start_codon:yes stop_codon:yes gene_type:complete
LELAFLDLETIKKLNVHYYNNQLRKFNIDQKIDLKIFNHSICIKDNDVFIVPNQFNETSISPTEFLGLKNKYQIKTVNMYDRTFGIKEKSIIIDHVNRSGVFHLKGNTPLEHRPMFPDMSYVYEKDPLLKSIIVQTLGYDRFKKNKLKERVFFSEAAAIIATIWHYVGVNVRGFAIPAK